MIYFQFSLPSTLKALNHTQPWWIFKKLLSTFFMFVRGFMINNKSLIMLQYSSWVELSIAILIIAQVKYYEFLIQGLVSFNISELFM